ncbi:hypothetical protein [Methanothermobacter sp. THM-2]|uniref:hypothetical protein n=1 Tax=Methanothermobacter sp. THM-2 TaxID=2606912 RepID=UPI001366341D|nr:hypothetical protein [Methanothermobacter sp. THM-2]QHN08752.1 hypothetical protein FZP68_08545 [Methanothermobacter sp. THM-2]
MKINGFDGEWMIQRILKNSEYRRVLDNIVSLTGIQMVQYLLLRRVVEAALREGVSRVIIADNYQSPEVFNWTNQGHSLFKECPH